MHPFTGLATREDGSIKVCCRSHPVGHISNNTLEEIWNNDNMKRIRAQVLNNQRPLECEPCFVLEDQGVESLRQRHISDVIPESRINLYPNVLDTLSSDFTMPFNFPTMEIKLNNLCNLKCRMCHPLDSTSWNDWAEVEEFYKKENNYLVQVINDLNLKRKPHIDKFEDNPNWIESFKKLLPYFRRVEFAGGEPLMDPEHYKILDMLKQYGNQIELKYATNGTTLGISKGRTIHDYWPHFKSVAVNVSLDGLHDVYEYIRGNSDFNQVVQNIKEIKKLPNISRVVGAVAVQVSNIMTIDEIVDYFLDELGIVFYTNMVKYPECLSIQALPIDIKREVTKKLEYSRTLIKDYDIVKQYPILDKITNTQLNGIINFMNSKNRYDELWTDTVEFNMRLDRSRNQNFLEVNPEFKPYV